MVRMFVRHSVTDFATWKKAFDEFDTERGGMGVTAHAVFQSVDDPNDVTLWHDFESAPSAKGFVESPRLREVMEVAGVVGAPQIWLTSQL